MDRHNPYQHHHHQLRQLQQLPAVDLSGGGGGERIPQWSVQETEELLRIREELDQAFMETKRNKLLWEVVASKMSDKGFVRTADQCKSKWKNLVTRFKGCETTEPEATRKQFPFYSEIQTIFSARMQRMLWSDTAEASTSSKRKPQISSDDDEEDEDEDDPEHEINDELLSLVEAHQKGTTGMTSNPRKRAKKAKGETPTTTTAMSGSSVKEVLEEFMRQMVKTEKEWREAYERKERERERREREWRRRMAELEEERVAAERRWMEKEEERRVREEVRAQKRDLLIDALLTRLNTDHPPPHHPHPSN